MTATWGRHWSGAVTNAYDSHLRRSSTQVAGKSATVNSYTYDNANRLATAGDGTYSATYSYLANSALAGTVTFKQSSTTRMTTRREYDLLNRLRRVESLSTATNTLGLVFDYQYNQANQRRRIDNGDGTHWAIEYDDLGQVVGGKKYWPDGSAVPGQQFEYDFDDIGNRTAHRYGGDATGQSSKLREVSYTANSLNQYTAKANVSVVDLLGLATEGSVVSVNGSTNGVYRRGEYFHRAATNTANTWPSLTNVVSKSGTSVTNVGSIFIPPTPEAFTHDADGNLTQDGRWDYTWDGENRLIQVESKSGFPAGSKRKLEFEYDWQGRRIKKVSHSAWNGSSYASVVTTKFIYDGWNLLAELDSSNNVVRSYVWGTDLSGTMQGAGGVGGLLFVKESDGTPHFAAFDGNGNVMGLVKGTDGTRTATYEYDPFGQPLRATGSMALANPMRFSTKFTDNETGFLYYGYRYYSPSLGGWANRDPKQERGSRNLYLFVENNAVDQIDKLGLTSWGQHRINEDACMKCGPDVTASIEAIFSTLRNYLATAPKLPITGNTEGNLVAQNIWFGQVAAKLDFARQIQEREKSAAPGSCPGDGCRDTITLCGKCVGSDVPGNIMFGYAARILGFGSWHRDLGAGMVEVIDGDGELIDDDNDQYDLGNALAGLANPTICTMVKQFPLSKTRAGCSPCKQAHALESPSLPTYPLYLEGSPYPITPF